MRLIITQIYIEVGVEYPFSHRFQQWLGKELSKRLNASQQFLSNYGVDYDLTFNISAKASLSEPDLRGPTRYRADKDVEFTIFLPFQNGNSETQQSCVNVFGQILDCVVVVLERLKLDGSKIIRDKDFLIREFSTTPGLITEM